MSRFTGKQYRGAMRDVRRAKHVEALARNATAQAQMRFCGHVHGAGRGCPEATDR